MPVKTKVALLLFGLFLGLLSAEIAARFYLFGSRGFSVEEMNSFRPFWNSNIWHTDTNSGISYSLKPNITIRHKFALVKTNQWGMNDKDYPLEKPKGVKRIGILGDSFSVATGVNRDENYHSIVEDKLNNDSVEILNFSAPAYNTANYLEVLTHQALSFSCDHIVIAFCPYNDFDSLQYQFEREQFISRPPVLNSSFGAIAKRTWYSLTTQRALEKYPSHNEFNSTLEMFTDIDSVCSVNAVTLSVFVVSYEYVAAIRSVKQLCGELNIPLSASYELFEEQDAQEYWLCRLDHHPNAKAHRVIATSFQNHLESVGF